MLIPLAILVLIELVLAICGRIMQLQRAALEFPNPGSFCKPGFSGLGKVKPGFRVRVRVWKSRICVHCKLEGGSAVAVDGWIGWANFFGSLSIISCCKIANIVGLIL